MSSETITPPKYAPNLYNPPDFATRESDSWGIDVFNRGPSSSNTYDCHFQAFLNLLGCTSFVELIDKLKSNGDVHVLDLMGGAYFLDPDQYQSVTSVTGMRLGNPEPGIVKFYTENIEFDLERSGGKQTEHSRGLLQELADIELLNREEKRKVVYGSVYDRSSWRSLDTSMRERKIDSFDLVICRPYGPFFERYITGEKPMSDKEKLRYGLVFDKAFREVLARVDKKNGVLFFQIPQIFDEQWILTWVKRAEARYGLKISAARIVDNRLEMTSHMFLARYDE